MMSDSYKKIQRQADIEWKFGLAKLWLVYFEDVYQLPVPFNLLPSVSAISNFATTVADFNRFMATMCRPCTSGKDAEAGIGNAHSEDMYIEEVIAHKEERTIKYEQVVRDLSRRYLIKRQQKQAFSGVTEDDLMEIKQDILSFKYELLDILKHNRMTIPDYITKHSVVTPTEGATPKGSTYFSFDEASSSESLGTRRHSVPDLFNNEHPSLFMWTTRAINNRRSQRRKLMQTLSLEQGLAYHQKKSTARDRIGSDEGNCGRIFTISEGIDMSVSNDETKGENSETNGEDVETDTAFRSVSSDSTEFVNAT